MGYKTTREMKEKINTIAKEFFLLEDNAIFVKKRKRELTEMKWYFYYFLRNETNLTLKQIGEFFNMNHATVLYGINNIFYYIDKKSYDCFKTIASKYINNDKVLMFEAIKTSLIKPPSNDVHLIKHNGEEYWLKLKE